MSLDELSLITELITSRLLPFEKIPPPTPAELLVTLLFRKETSDELTYRPPPLFETTLLRIFELSIVTFEFIRPTVPYAP